MICDFCSSENPVWRHRAESFDLPPEYVHGVTRMRLFKTSLGDWAACEECHDLIVRSRWGELRDRSVRSFYARWPHLSGVLTPDELTEFVENLHAMFRRLRRVGQHLRIE